MEFLRLKWTVSDATYITGGIVFTGIFASFWKVNIFSRPELLAATSFFSILPDIDHLKSPISTAFYPLAKWLDRRYGHRTNHAFTHGIYSGNILRNVSGTCF